VEGRAQLRGRAQPQLQLARTEHLSCQARWQITAACRETGSGNHVERSRDVSSSQPDEVRGRSACDGSLHAAWAHTAIPALHAVPSGPAQQFQPWTSSSGREFFTRNR